MAQEDVTMLQECGGEAGGMALRSSTKPGPTQDSKEIVRRLLEMRPFAASKQHKADFNPDTFVRLAKEHSDKYSIRTFGEAERNRLRMGPQTVVFQQVATFKENHFFKNPYNSDETFSVINEEMRRLAVERGFVEYYPTHYTDKVSMPLKAATTDEGTNSAWKEQPGVGVSPPGKT
jgi:hypothetical protein